MLRITTSSALVLYLGLLLDLLSRAAAANEEREVGSSSSLYVTPPSQWLPSSLESEDFVEWKQVISCCQRRDKSCAYDEQGCATDNDEPSNNNYVLEKTAIGRMPQFTTHQSLEVLQHAQAAWRGGAGVWTQMTLKERCQMLENFLQELESRREVMVETLLQEIGKNRPDAESEFDRTIQFGRQLIQTIQSSSSDDPEFVGGWQKIGTTIAFVRRNAIGIFLTLAPFNYPLNESYACILPLLLMGNVVILKIPTVGGLVHLLTMDAFRQTLPPGTVGFVSGSGRATMPPLMETGKIDGLAFIGGSQAADDLIRKHPHPHRLKLFLQLEAKNMAIYLSDIFEDTLHSNAAAVAFEKNALDEAVAGSLSYNGQRCTALKLHFVPLQHAERFVTQLASRVEALPVGLGDEQHEAAKQQQYSKITPLPTTKRVKYMKELIDDALQKGAKIMNKDGGTIVGGPDSTLMIPAVLYPVTSDMRVYHEEQFGPVVPVAPYTDLEQVLLFGQEGPYGQQVSIFTAQDAEEAARILDRFSAVFAKVNLNSQCGRSPDTLPFAGRRSSALGVMSVKDALREFSVPTVVAYKENNKNVSGGLNNTNLAKGIEAKANFLQPVA